MGSRRALKVHRAEEDGCLCLRLSGELDLATAPLLEDRLRALKAEKLTVRLNLSDVQFIDSTGLHVLLRAVHDSRRDGWELEIEPEVSYPVRRLLQLVNVEGFLFGGDGGQGDAAASQT